MAGAVGWVWFAAVVVEACRALRVLRFAEAKAYSGRDLERKMSPKITYAVDYKGQPVDKTRAGGWLSAAFILVLEACERFTTLGISANMVIYAVGTLHLPSATAANIVSNFGGAGFMLCLLGGFVADSFLGRYWTIAISSLIIAIGSALLSISCALPSLRPPPCNPNSSTCIEANGFQVGVLVAALYVIALGQGGIKANVSGFGTDQFDENDKKEKSKMDYFFSRFYFVISLGSLLSVTVGIYVQDNVSRSWGYGLCCFAFFFGSIFYLLRTRKYRYKKCVGSPIVQVLNVLVAALRKSKLKSPTNVDTLYNDSTDDSTAPRIRHTDQLRWMDKAAIIDENDYGTNGSVIRNRWKLCSVTKVEEVKMIVRLLPIWASTIYFWCIHSQVLTFSVEQANTLERSIGNFLIPAGSFNVFYIAGILIGAAFYDRVIIPLMKRWKGKHGFTNLQRIAIGMVFSILAMAVASIVETRRLAVVRVVGGNVTTLPMQFYILIPQFFLVGLAESFTYSGQLDFFITRSPKGMKSMSTGIFLSTVGLGFFVSTFLVSIVNQVTGTQIGTGWLTSNLNYGKLYFFYALLAILSFTNLIFFILCAIWYVRTMKNSSQIESIITSSEEEEKHAMQKEGTLTASAAEDYE
ncbi:protein NRT1/ PTR FAMILY 6.2-like [Telopea speciosissima]|uniref:protein NRT1/ PTR FAMILY 6.2-like n=1 Tax=Telopea speciosissima TaxID=54955 RepID=UPI001CC74F4E|nr:protein NRT1/ PTR FAMILY 6.2-like [Telopea speciosissima]